MFPVSTHGGQAVLAFPDVCKTPTAPAGPVPIAYPNIGTLGGAKTAPATKPAYATKTAAYKTAAYKTPGDEAAGLKSHLAIVHQKLMALPGGNTTQWHALVDDYVMTSAELFKSLSSR